MSKKKKKKKKRKKLGGFFSCGPAIGSLLVVNDSFFILVNKTLYIFPIL